MLFCFNDEVAKFTLVCVEAHHPLSLSLAWERQRFEDILF